MSQLQSFRPNPKKPRSGGHSAQAIVEFSLTLLVFLLTLIMIIEIARILQAFITVQHAARMAGRYAVTGSFYDHYNDLDTANTLDTAQEDNGNITGATVGGSGITGGNGPGWNASATEAIQRILPCRPIMHTTQDGRQDPLVAFYPFGSAWAEGVNWDHRLYSMYEAQATYVSAYPFYQPFRNARTCSIEEVAIRAMTGIPLDPNAPGRTNPDTGQLYGGYYDVQVRSAPSDSSPQNSTDLFDRSDSRGGSPQTDVALSQFYGDPSFAGEQGGICLDSSTSSWTTITGVDTQTARTQCEALSANHEYFDTNDALVSGYGGAPSEPVVIQINYNLPIITPILSDIAPAVPVEGVAVMINEPFGNTGLQQQAQLPPENLEVAPLPNAPQLAISEIVPELTCYDSGGTSGELRIGYFNRNSTSVVVDNDQIVETAILNGTTISPLLAQFDNGRNANLTTVNLGVGQVFTWQITISDDDGFIQWDDTLRVERTGSTTYDVTLLSDGVQNAPASTDTLTAIDCATVDAFGSSAGGPATGTITFQPGQVTLIRPGDTASVASVSTTGAFEWTAVDGAEWYYVWIGYFDATGYPSGNLIEEGNDWMEVGADLTCDDDDSDGVVTCRGVPSIALGESFEYAWYVRPYTTGDPGWQDANGLGPWSFPRYFSLTQPPLVPAVLYYPIQDEVVASNPPTLQWVQKDNVTESFIYMVSQGSGVVYRELYDSDDLCSSTGPSGGQDLDGDSVTLASDEVWCELTPTFSVPLQIGKYTWWVRVSNAQDPNGVWTADGQEFELTTAPPLPSAPAAPTLISPVGLTLTTDSAAQPDFVFSDVGGALEYAVYLEDSLGNEVYFQWFEANAICPGTGSAGTCTVPYPFTGPLATDNYVWNARAWNVVDFSPWSADGNFEVAILPPGAPIGITTLQYPTGGLLIDDAEATAQSLVSKERPKFRWSKYVQDGAEEIPTSYRLVVRDADTPTDVEIDIIIPVGSLTDGGSYWEYEATADLDTSDGVNFEWFVRPINSVSFGNYAGPGTFSIDALPVCFAGLTFDFEDSANLGATYVDNPFSFGDARGNGGATSAAAAISNAGGNNGTDGIGVILGPQSTNMQGGYQFPITLAQAITGEITFDYRLEMPNNYESPEFSQVVLEVDNTLYGTGGNDYIAQNNDGGTLGWTTVTVPVGSLSAGAHTIVLGGYNNASTEPAEVTSIFFDNVMLTDPCATATATPVTPSVSPPAGSFTTQSYDFESGVPTDFSYADNVITGRPTGSAGDASALNSPTGQTGQGIGVRLEGDPAQGAWEVDFTLSGTLGMEVALDYRLATFNIESNPSGDDEFGQVIVELGSTLFQVLENPQDNGQNYNSGWQSTTLDLGTLNAGTYTLRFGGHMTAQDNSNENVRIFYDNIEIRQK